MVPIAEALARATSKTSRLLKRDEAAFIFLDMPPAAPRAADRRSQVGGLEFLVDRRGSTLVWLCNPRDNLPNAETLPGDEAICISYARAPLDGGCWSSLARDVNHVSGTRPRKATRDILRNATHSAAQGCRSEQLNSSQKSPNSRFSFSPIASTCFKLFA
jgi:hypothetical protein